MKPPDYHALGNLRFQIRRFLHFSEEAARLEGLEPQQHQLMLAIRGLEEHGEGPTIGSLAEHLLIRHNSAVGLVDRLAERHLVERIREDRDRRQVHVHLTAAGDEKLRRLSRAHHEELQVTGPLLVSALSSVLEEAAAAK